MMPMGGMGIGMVELVIIVLVVGLFLAYLVSQREMGGSVSEEVHIDWDVVRKERFRDYILRGKKADAIKIYREQTGVDYREAQRAVEYLITHPEAGKPKKRPPMASDAGVRDLVSEGRIDEAIDAYRQFTGVDYYTAEAAVKDIQREMRLDEPDETDVSLDDLMRSANKEDDII